MSKWAWNGREVIFTEFNIAAGREMRKAFAEDTERGTYVALIKSARYADDGSPVFQSIEEIEAQPFRLQQRIMLMAVEASKVNSPEEDPDVPLH
jgi:hypothetical protein